MIYSCNILIDCLVISLSHFSSVLNVHILIFKKGKCSCQVWKLSIRCESLLMLSYSPTITLCINDEKKDSCSKLQVSCLMIYSIDIILYLINCWLSKLIMYCFRMTNIDYFCSHIYEMWWPIFFPIKWTYIGAR